MYPTPPAREREAKMRRRRRSYSESERPSSVSVISPNNNSRAAKLFHAPGQWLAEHSFAVGILIALAVALLSEMPWVGRPLRIRLLQGLVVSFAVFLATLGRPQENLQRAFLRGPAPWIIALMLWLAWNTIVPPSHGYGIAELLRPFAIAELLRMIFCAGVFFAVAYCLKPQDIKPVVYGTLGTGALVSLYGLFEFGNISGWEFMHSIFGNHEQVGSYLMLMVPVALALAVCETKQKSEMLTAQVLAVILTAGVLLARTRSAWVGEFIAILTFVAINFRHMTPEVTKTNKFAIVGPIVVLTIGFAMLAFSDQLAPMLTTRASSFSHVIDDSSFADRLHRWKSACRMAYERPIAGWGLGSFPVIQSHWTGQGDPPEHVIEHGTGHINLAHNFWVQWAAETGGVGVGLYAAVFAAFFVSAGLRLRGARIGFSRALLVGCIATAAGAMGDMAGAPSYTFPGVSALPWLWMGLGVAACRNISMLDTGKRSGVAALPPTPWWGWFVAAVFGIAVATAIITIGALQPALTYTAVNGH